MSRFRQSLRVSPGRLNGADADAVQQLGRSDSVGRIFKVVQGSPQHLLFPAVAAHHDVSPDPRFRHLAVAIRMIAAPRESRERYIAATGLRRFASANEPGREFIPRRRVRRRSWQGNALFVLPLVQKFFGAKG